MSDESNALREKVESHIKWRDERFFGSNDTKTEPLLRDMLAIITALEVEVTWHESDHAAALAQIESLTREKAELAQYKLDADHLIKELGEAQTALRQIRDTLRAEFGAAKVNEARYLWMRNEWLNEDIGDPLADVTTVEQLDAAIDTARSRGETGAAK